MPLVAETSSFFYTSKILIDKYADVTAGLLNRTDYRRQWFTPPTGDRQVRTVVREKLPCMLEGERRWLLGLPKGPFGNIEYASDEIWNMEYEHAKGNTGHSPYMKSGIWDQENDPILEYGKRGKYENGNMK